METKHDLLELFLAQLRTSLFLTFEKQAGLPVRLIEAPPIGPGVIADLNAIDPHHEARLRLIFSEASFLAIANHMLGENEARIGDGNISLAPELLNLIYASARTGINQAGHAFKPAIPYLPSPTASESNLLALPPTRINCECSLGRIALEIRLGERK